MYSGPSAPVPSMVSVFNPQIGWMTEATSTAFAVSATFEAANQAVYVPIILPSVCVVRRVWWANGGTVSASYSVDVGVYADSGYGPGSRLVSAGSTAQGTASQVQFVNVTDTTLAPGLYWIGMACSSASATFLRASLNTTSWDAAFRFEEASALPLPATATPVETTNASVYLCGFATTP